MSKKKRINWKRISIFLAVCALILGLIIFGIIKLINRAPAPNKCIHVFENGTCKLCGFKCPHEEYEGGVCKLCKTECLHAFSEGKCILCDYVCPHDFDGNVCIICGESKSSLFKSVLLLVNKKEHLPSDYKPDDLVTVERNVEGVGNSFTKKLRREAADAINKMFDAAEAEGIVLKMRTGFRSYEYQTDLYNSYVKNHGEAEANKFSAKPGESEHQTGLAADLGGESQKFALRDDFGSSKEGKWVKDNCWKYGFILRYTDGTLTEPGEYTGYIYEAWHVRYVGTQAAKEITERGITLEQYLAAE